jgi:thiosulfate dehydrogenase (quinone) large subunit
MEKPMGEKEDAMKSACDYFDPKSAGVAVARWALGLLLFYGGLGKLMGGVSGFVTGYLATQFAKTFLPPVLISIYGYILPFVELTLGFLLILGLLRNYTLLLSGLTFISLAFGQMLLQKHEVVATIFIYIAINATLLFLDEYDSWVIRKKTESRQ